MNIDEKYLSDLQIYYEKCRAKDDEIYQDQWTGRIDTCIAIKRDLQWAAELSKEGN